MPNHIIELAGGENIFKDIQKKQAWVRVFFCWRSVREGFLRPG
jgi:hypothetical protein